MKETTTIVGGDKLRAALQKLAAAGPQILAGALYREAEAIMTEAKQRTPVKTGNLRASGQVHAPEITGTGVTVTLGFGNAAVGYAVYVHENLTARHPVGEAKFLERPLLAAAEGMDARLATAISGAITAVVSHRGGGGVSVGGESWKQFVASRMSAAMRETGSHGAAMKKLGAEWKARKR